MTWAPHVAIGPIVPADLPRLFAWGNDPAIVRHNEAFLPKNIEHERDFWLNSAGDRTRVFFAIRAASAPGVDSAQIIGYVQIFDIHPIHRSASLGLLVGAEEHRGRGVGKAAMGLAIAYCWRHLNLSRLALSVQAENHAAIAVYTQLGFATEGTLARAQFIDGAWVDLRLMALMRPERAAITDGRPTAGS